MAKIDETFSNQNLAPIGGVIPMYLYSVLEHLSTRHTVMPPLHVNPPKMFWDRRKLLVPCESLDVQAFSRWVDWLIRSSSVPSDRGG